MCIRDRAQLRQLADDTDALAALHVVPDHAGLALVLVDLILVDTHAGLVHGHAGQRRSGDGCGRAGGGSG